jgi:fatty acid desaturase
VATEDKRRQFDEIVARLTAESPSLGKPPRRRWRTPFLAVTLVVAALAWGLLSVLMVAWGWPGVVITCLVVAATVAVGVWHDRRRRQPGN